MVSGAYHIQMNVTNLTVLEQVRKQIYFGVNPYEGSCTPIGSVRGKIIGLNELTGDICVQLDHISLYMYWVMERARKLNW